MSTFDVYYAEAFWSGIATMAFAVFGAGVLAELFQRWRKRASTRDAEPDIDTLVLTEALKYLRRMNGNAVLDEALTVDPYEGFLMSDYERVRVDDDEHEDGIYTKCTMRGCPAESRTLRRDADGKRAILEWERDHTLKHRQAWLATQTPF